MTSINKWINLKALFSHEKGFYTSQDYASYCTYEDASDFKNPRLSGVRRFCELVKSEIKS